MEVLNRKERTSALILFLIMFVIAVGVLMTAIFFSNKLPYKEIGKLRKENRENRFEINYQKDFTDQLGILNKMVDSLAGDIYNGILRRNITNELADIGDRIEKDSLKNKGVYLRMLDIYTIHMRAIDRLKEQQECKDEIEELKEKIDDYKEKIDDLESDLRHCELMRKR